MQPMDISSSIPNGGRSSPNIGNGGLNRHGMGMGRMDSDPSLYVPEGNSALSRRRICIALSLSVVLLILIGPSDLRGEAELSRTAGDGGRKRRFRCCCPGNAENAGNEGAPR